MASLCPRCGSAGCDHSAAERRQTPEEFQEDKRRFLTESEKRALLSGNAQDKIAAANQVWRERRRGTFRPKFYPVIPMES